MSYTYHGTTDLIALPNRTVQTYPSGLVRVERSFVCRKDRVARFRNTIKVNEPMPFDDGAPAIDGLYIFPEPQEVVRDDGFVEFRVTAYGRTSFGPPPEISVFQGSFQVSEEDFYLDEEGFSVRTEFRLKTVPAAFERYIYRKVVPREEPLLSIYETPLIDGKIYLADGQVFSTSGNRDRTIFLFNGSANIYFNLTNSTNTNFGYWSEWVYEYKVFGNANRRFTVPNPNLA